MLPGYLPILIDRQVPIFQTLTVQFQLFFLENVNEPLNDKKGRGRIVELFRKHDGVFELEMVAGMYLS